MRIAIYLDAITGGFETDLVRAQKISARAFKEIKKEAAEANKRLGNVFTGAIAAGTAAFAVALKSGVDHMDDMSKAAQRAGTSTEFMSAMAYRAKLSDVAVQGLGGAFKKLSVNMAEAQSKEGDMRTLFATTLGVEIQNADGSLRDLSEVFPEIADRMDHMRDGGEKTAIMIKLFGKAGADLIPLMQGGAASIRETTEEAREFGLVVSTEAGKAAEEFNDNMTRLGSVAQGAGVELANYLMPSLTELAEKALKLAKDPAFKEGLAEAIRTIGEVAMSAATGVVTLANNLGFLWDEAKQRVGIVDDDDIVRLQEQRDALADVIALLEKTPQRDKNSLFEQETRAAIVQLDARIRLAQDVVAARVRAEQAMAGLEEIDTSRFPQKKFDFIKPPQLPDSGADKEAEKLAKQVAKLRMDALGEEEQGVEQLRQKYAELDELLKNNAVTAAEAAKIRAGLARELVEPLRDSALTDEQRAVEQLSLQYTKLKNAVDAGALSREEADRLGARYAEEWRRAEEDKVFQFRVSNGLVSEQEQALHALRLEMEAIDRLAQSSEGGLPGGIADFSQGEADALKREAQAKFDQSQERANRDEFNSLSSGLLQQGEYDLSPFEQSLQSETDMVNEHYDALEESILTSTKLREDQVTDLMIRSAEARKAALDEIDSARTQGQLQMWGDAFGQLASLMQSHNTKLFRIGQAAAIAQATINIAQGITEAIKLPWPVNIVAAVATAAAGAVQVATILSAKPPQAYDKGGDIPAGELGWVAERGNEIVSASREPMLLTEPTLVRGPAHVTSRRETEQLMRDRSRFAGMFDEGGFIPPGQWGIAAERRPELLTADGIPTPPMQKASSSGDQRPIYQTHIHVWDEEEAARRARRSGAWEEVTIHHSINNPGRISRGR